MNKKQIIEITCRDYDEVQVSARTLLEGLAKRIWVREEASIEKEIRDQLTVTLRKASVPLVEYSLMPRSETYLKLSPRERMAADEEFTDVMRTVYGNLEGEFLKLTGTPLSVEDLSVLLAYIYWTIRRAIDDMEKWSNTFAAMREKP